MNTMTGKSVMVTGATSGIGLETARELAALGARVLVHGRTLAKAEVAAATVSAAAGDAGGSAVPVHADLGSLAQVSDLARQAGDAAGRLDVLINNAGTFQTARQLSEDGFEYTLAVNHLAPVLLTNLLVPLLCASGQPRVITVTSMAHYKGELDFNDLMLEREYDGHAAYNASKLANILFASELTRRVPCGGLTSNAVAPGVIATKLLETGFPGSKGAPVDEGAETIVYLASSPDVTESSGELFARLRTAHASPKARDAALAAQLWNVSVDLIGLDVAG